MSLAAFQSALARLVAEPGFALAVRGGSPVRGLDERERARLLAAAHDPGLDAAISVQVGWRLGKLLSLLPLTRTALGSRLGERVRVYWAEHPPRELYFEREALEFAGAVRDDPSLPAATREIAAFEIAEIRLAGEHVEAIEVTFTHDPEALIAAVAHGADLRSVPRRHARLMGRRDGSGRCTWSLASQPSPAGRPSRR